MTDPADGLSVPRPPRPKFSELFSPRDTAAPASPAPGKAVGEKAKALVAEALKAPRPESLKTVGDVLNGAGFSLSVRSGSKGDSQSVETCDRWFESSPR